MSADYNAQDDHDVEDPTKESQQDGLVHANQMDIEIFRSVTEHFRQDIREFFTRSNFYLLAETALLSVFFTREIPETLVEFVMSTGIAICGFIVAILWWCVAKSAVVWIDRWRDEVRRLDKLLDRHKSYANVEEQALEHCRKRPKRPECVTQYLPLVFCFAWVLSWILILYFFLERRVQS